MRCSAGLLLMLVAAPAMAGPLTDALSDGEAKLQLRYRYEFIDADGVAENANASTLRGRLSWRSASYNNASLLLEMDALTTVFIDDYNSGAGTSSASRNRYPVVADPDYTEVNQMYLQYDGIDGAAIRIGRQRINLDNQRFVGGVGWRQNEQTYDAVSLGAEFDDKTARFFYAFVDNVNRIFGDDVAAGDHDSSTHLLNLSREFSDRGMLSLYHYALRNDDVASTSSNTLGLRWSGKAMPGQKALQYLIEYADQSDAGNNPVNFNADYLRLDADLALKPLSLQAGYEKLSGSASQAGVAFRTPLATLHAFNGWADQFLTTPGDGLVDVWIGVSTKLGLWQCRAVAHRFDADDGGQKLGSELDLSASRKFGDSHSLLLKAALFRADSSARTDVSKLWLMYGGSF